MPRRTAVRGVPARRRSETEVARVWPLGGWEVRFVRPVASTARLCWEISLWRVFGPPAELEDGALEDRAVLALRWYGWPGAPWSETEAAGIVAAAARARASDRVEFRRVREPRGDHTVLAREPGSGVEFEIANGLPATPASVFLDVRQVGGEPFGPAPEVLYEGDVLIGRPTMEEAERGVGHREVLLVRRAHYGSALVDRGFGGTPIEAWEAGQRFIAAGRV